MLKKGLFTLMAALAFVLTFQRAVQWTAQAQDDAPAASELGAAGPTLPAAKSVACTAAGDGTSASGAASAAIADGEVKSVSSDLTDKATRFPYSLGSERARSGASGDKQAWLIVEYREYWFGLFIGNRSCSAWVSS